MRDVLKAMPPQERGHNFEMLSATLRRFGLRTEGRRMSFDKLTRCALPAIAYLRPDHWVVVAGVDDQGVKLYDGLGKAGSTSTEKFRSQWSNMLLKVWGDPRDGPLPPTPSSLVGQVVRIQFDRLILNKGEVPSTGEPTEYLFAFRNLGDSPLSVRKVRTSCTCLRSTKPQRSIPPGGSGQILLEFHPETKGGPFRHSVYVETNDPVTPLVRLTAEGWTDVKVRPNPRALDFGKIPSDALEGRVRRICLSASAGARPKVRLVKYAVAAGRVSFRAWTRSIRKDLPRSARVHRNPRDVLVDVRCLPAPGFVGPIRGTLYIHTDVKGSEQIRVRFQGEIVHPIEFRPSLLFLGEISPGQVIDQSLQVTSRYGRPFRILSVDTSGTRLECRYPKQTIRRGEIRFAGSVQASAGPIEGQIRVTVSLNGVDVPLHLALPVYGLVSRDTDQP